MLVVLPLKTPAKYFASSVFVSGYEVKPPTCLEDWQANTLLTNLSRDDKTNVIFFK